jgi:hypothetical protein
VSGTDRDPEKEILVQKTGKGQKDKCRKHCGSRKESSNWISWWNSRRASWMTVIQA